MFGLDAYGSDSSDAEDAPRIAPASTTKAAAAPTAAPKVKKPVRIVVDALPKPSRALEDAEDDRPAKKQRVEAGKGKSSLLSMLPAPKTAPAAPPKPVPAPSADSAADDNDAEQEQLAKPALLVPTTVRKAAAANPSATKPKPAVNFFSFGESSSSSSSRAAEASSSSSVRISSAPEIHEYEPPEPTPTDPYPGYYQMPNGQWAAYEPAYYKLSGTTKGFEGVDEDDLESFSAMDESARARAAIEDTKNITKNIKTGPDAPKMNIAKTQKGSLANQRHQLSTLLHSAYTNREAIEEKIAISRRNRKESGNKYAGR
ncbi:mitotic checkpoint regulator, MAD2B-interacting-domain-containing protein [Auriculariales sp. MPI-PUGE-AT-0066]|nr:mitotic checkpoint regulator, MAD2B-interacting-domain-containing protein [Auriculariales sp. MPI-PUGE-AT-0066]